MRVKCVETTSPFEVFKVGGWYYFKKGVENIYEDGDSFGWISSSEFKESYATLPMWQAEWDNSRRMWWIKTDEEGKVYFKTEQDLRDENINRILE
jgi:hypothetical protein